MLLLTAFINYFTICGKYCPYFLENKLGLYQGHKICNPKYHHSVHFQVSDTGSGPKEFLTLNLPVAQPCGLPF